jgi:hypothetical protein
LLELMNHPALDFRPILRWNGQLPDLKKRFDTAAQWQYAGYDGSSSIASARQACIRKGADVKRSLVCVG